MLTEKQIIHDTGKFWVLATKTGYAVMKNNLTHSESDGIEYPLNDDGKSIAIAYCNYRTKRSA